MRHHETETKIAIADLAAIRRKLRKLGFQPIHRRAFEDNVLFDTPARALRAVRCILRLRRYGSRWWLTFKGTPEADSRYKSRTEYESEVSNPEAVLLIFSSLGLVPVFRYQKFRTHFAAARALNAAAKSAVKSAVGKRASSRQRARRPAFEIVLDETPVGNFIELEGSRSAIDRAAKQLGFSSADYSTASYGALYIEWCKRLGREPGDMVFDVQP
ncbi:MAG: CYTH domain-containing protein [Acidobacteria bacterium]|nr:CYTH domain-containing protein [Acidobacteriota bacterium]